MYLDITLTAKNWHRAHPLQDRALSEHQWSACDAESACVDVLVVHSAFQRSRPRHPGESDRLDRSSRSGLPTFVRSSGLLRRRCDQAGWRARHQTFNACHRFAKALALEGGYRRWRSRMAHAMANARWRHSFDGGVYSYNKDVVQADVAVGIPAPKSSHGRL